MVWYSHLFKNFQFVVIHTVRGFGVVNKAEIGGFLELSCFLDDPMDVGNLTSVLDTLSGYSGHVSGLCDFLFFTNGLIVRQVTEFICLRDGPCYILTTSLEGSCHR